MRRATWTTPARADLAAIDEYYAERDPDYADRVGRQAIAAGGFLTQHPHAGEEVAAQHRRWHVRGTPYLLIYHVVPEGVEILRVWHERQDRIAGS